MRGCRGGRRWSRPITGTDQRRASEAGEARLAAHRARALMLLFPAVGNRQCFRVPPRLQAGPGPNEPPIHRLDRWYHGLGRSPARIGELEFRGFANPRNLGRLAENPRGRRSSQHGGEPKTCFGPGLASAAKKHARTGQSAVLQECCTACVAGRLPCMVLPYKFGRCVEQLPNSAEQRRTAAEQLFQIWIRGILIAFPQNTSQCPAKA